MTWNPWKLRAANAELRAASGLTEMLMAERQAAAEGDGEALAVAEICAGLYSRAFAQADFSGVSVSLFPDLMALVGRCLLSSGEVILYLGSENNRFHEPVPAASWDIQGSGIDPLGWRYRVSVGAPSGQREFNAGALDVLHFRINASPAAPWKGRSPFALASTTAAVAQKIERHLTSEFKLPTGAILALPSGTDDSTVPNLKKDLKVLAGQILLLETMTAGWGQGTQSAPRRDYDLARIQPRPTEETTKLRDEIGQALLAAAGIPIELAVSAEGSSTREGWRRFLHGTVDPLGRVVLAEIRRKLQGNPSLNFDRLFASDLSGRARAFQSMVGGGMAIERAAALAGLLERD